MLRRRLPVIIVIVLGIFLGIGLAGLPNSAQTPPVSTVKTNARSYVQQADPGIDTGAVN